MTLREAFDAADLKLLLVSDLHIYDHLDEHETRPSFLKVGDPEDLTGANPLADLKALITTQHLTADVILCLGDLADKARPAGIRYGWQKLQELSHLLKAGTLLATSGNHDCDSRHTYNDFDAKGVLQSLSPAYPLDDDTMADHYWSRNFVTIQTEQYRIVSLNSSAFHGTANEEIQHGRISRSTLEKLQNKLVSSTEPTVNILICHHHPHPHSELGLGEHDLMTSGVQLLTLLGSGDYGRWLIIHGHKHHPKITYAQGLGSSPTVLACGSLSACLYPELGTNVRNQFHIVCVNYGECNKFGFVGRIYTWEWAAGTGWTDALRANGLPAISGFGYRCDPSQIAKQISSYAIAKRLAWASIRDRLPEIDFILPEEYDLVRRQLKAKWQLEVLERDGVPFEIGRLG